MEDSLKQEIYSLERELANKKEKLFKTRLFRIIGKNENEISKSGISNIKLDITLSKNTPQEWSISYTHTTNDFNEIKYDIDYENLENSKNDESLDNLENIYTENAEKNCNFNIGVNTENKQKTTSVVFGKNKKYFIRISDENVSRFKIYKNSMNKLRIINTDYDIELDLSEQDELMNRYSSNIDIPEWFAIKVFMFMKENEWDDENIVIHLSKV